MLYKYSLIAKTPQRGNKGLGKIILNVVLLIPDPSCCLFLSEDCFLNLLLEQLETFVRKSEGDLRDVSGAKSTGCPCRGLGFGSQHTRDSSLTTCNSSSSRSDTLLWSPCVLHTCMYMMHIHTCRHTQHTQNLCK